MDEDDDINLYEEEPFRFLFTISLIIFACAYYVFDNIQRKLMGNSITEMTKRLEASREKLRELEKQKEHLDSTMKILENASSEYNLLFYLLVKERDAKRSMMSEEPMRRSRSFC